MASSSPLNDTLDTSSPAYGAATATTASSHPLPRTTPSLITALSSPTNGGTGLLAPTGGGEMEMIATPSAANLGPSPPAADEPLTLVQPITRMDSEERDLIQTTPTQNVTPQPVLLVAAAAASNQIEPEKKSSPTLSLAVAISSLVVLIAIYGYYLAELISSYSAQLEQADNLVIGSCVFIRVIVVSFLVSILVIGLSLVALSFYVVTIVEELDNWQDTDCDSNTSTSGSDLQTESTNSSHIIFLSSSSSTGAASSALSTRTDMGKTYLIACSVIQFVCLVGTILFALCLSHSNFCITILGACLDAMTLGVFVWGVWLYLSGTVCSFYFFKLTLIYCIVVIFLFIILINSWGNRARIKRRGQTAGISFPDGAGEYRRNQHGHIIESKSNSQQNSRGSRGSRDRDRERTATERGIRVGGIGGIGSGGPGHYGHGTSGGGSSGGSGSGTIGTAGSGVIRHTPQSGSLPTLKPFQHPAFPPEAQVPLFVVHTSARDLEQRVPTETNPDDEIQDLETEHA